MLFLSLTTLGGNFIFWPVTLCDKLSVSDLSVFKSPCKVYPWQPKRRIKAFVSSKLLESTYKHDLNHWEYSPRTFPNRRYRLFLGYTLPLSTALDPSWSSSWRVAFVKLQSKHLVFRVSVHLGTLLNNEANMINNWYFNKLSLTFKNVRTHTQAHMGSSSAWKPACLSTLRSYSSIL